MSMIHILSALLILSGALFLPSEATVRGGRELSTLAVTKFRLIDAITNTTLLDPLLNRSVYHLDPTRPVDLAIEAVTSGVVGSVRIDNRVENFVPWSRCGDKLQRFLGCPDLNKVGRHTIAATAYHGVGATGKVSAPLTVTFTVKAGTAPTAAPVAPLTGTIKTVGLSTPVSPPPPLCQSDEYFDGLQEQRCRKFCTAQAGCSDLNGSGPFPDYFKDDYLCANTPGGNQCAAKVANDQCVGGCGANEQCVETTAGDLVCACKYTFGRHKDGSCRPVCYDSFPYGSCGKYGACQNTARGPLCTEIGGTPYCHGTCAAADEFCGRYTQENNVWSCLKR